jgi:hypothetical protein
MNWRTCFLLTVSILGATNLSCHGPESAALDPMIAGDFDRSGSAQSPLDTGISKTEIETTVSESHRDCQSRVEKIREEKELMMLAGLAASLL